MKYEHDTGTHRDEVSHMALDGRPEALASVNAEVAGRRIGRRDLFRFAGMGAGSLGAGTLLAACGVQGKGGQAEKTASKKAVQNFWAGKHKTGRVSFGNWPLYIDVASHDNSKHPSLDLFINKTGITVNYDEVKQSDEQLFAKLHPSLAADQWCGYDIVTVANSIWLPKWRELGYLVPLDHDRMHNFTKYAGDKYVDPAYDPHNTYTMPWQSGFTGIAYDPDKTGRAITSYEDLMDPKFKGKIGMLSDISELPNIALLAVGVEPKDSTQKDWKKAARWLEKQKPLVRKYYQSDYIEALAKGDIWITQAWSGDIFQQNLSGTNFKFVNPKEGALLWIDNFVLLAKAKHAVDAMELMDFYFRPKVAAMVAEYVNYITPVPKAKHVVEQDAAEASGDDAKYLRQVAHSYAVFPSQKAYDDANLYRHRLSGKQLETWNSIFEPIYQS